MKCAVPPADATAAETLAALVNVPAEAATNFIAEQAKTNRQREQDMKSMKKLEESAAMRRALAASAKAIIAGADKRAALNAFVGAVTVNKNINEPPKGRYTTFIEDAINVQALQRVADL